MASLPQLLVRWYAQGDTRSSSALRDRLRVRGQDPFVRALAHRDPRVRTGAAAFLAFVGIAEPILDRIAVEKDYKVQAEMLRRLTGTSLSEKELFRVFPFTRSAYDEVCAAALEVLELHTDQLFRKRSLRRELLAALSHVLRFGGTQALQQAKYLLEEGRFLESERCYLSEAAALALETEKDRIKREHLIHALIALNHPIALPVLRKRLGLDDPDYVQMRIITHLAHHRDVEAFEKLAKIACAQWPDKLLRRFAVQALAEIDIRRAEPLFFRLMQDNSEEIVSTAIRMLGRYGDHQTLHRLNYYVTVHPEQAHQLAPACAVLAFRFSKRDLFLRLIRDYPTAIETIVDELQALNLALTAEQRRLLLLVRHHPAAALLRNQIDMLLASEHHLER